LYVHCALPLHSAADPPLTFRHPAGPLRPHRVQEVQVIVPVRSLVTPRQGRGEGKGSMSAGSGRAAAVGDTDLAGGKVRATWAEPGPGSTAARTSRAGRRGAAIPGGLHSHPLCNGGLRLGPGPARGPRGQGSGRLVSLATSPSAPSGLLTIRPLASLRVCSHCRSRRPPSQGRGTQPLR
jgi:hypothetical protein